MCAVGCSDGDEHQACEHNPCTIVLMHRVQQPTGIRRLWLYNRLLCRLQVTASLYILR